MVGAWIGCIALRMAGCMSEKSAGVEHAAQYTLHAAQLRGKCCHPCGRDPRRVDMFGA